ncbi:hypothetical protein JTE90_014532, partial [Oedothorax gibbosus]
MQPLREKRGSGLSTGIARKSGIEPRPGKKLEQILFSPGKGGSGTGGHAAVQDG